jgi:hypothetical protein
VDFELELVLIFRVVQMTPPGSACSVTIGTGITDAAPGSYRGTHLAVAEEQGEWRPGPDPSHADYSSFADFSDPDSNTWVLQEVRVGKAGT